MVGAEEQVSRLAVMDFFPDNGCKLRDMAAAALSTSLLHHGRSFEEVARTMADRVC